MKKNVVWAICVVALSGFLVGSCAGAPMATPRPALEVPAVITTPTVPQGPTAQEQEAARQRAAEEARQQAVAAAAAAEEVRQQAELTPTAFEQGIARLAREIEQTLPAGTRVAVVALESPSAKLSSYVLDELQGTIVNGRKLTVVERRNIEPLRNELDFGMTGEVDDETAALIGHFLGAAVIVSGTFTDQGDRYRLRFNAVRTNTAVHEASPAATILRDDFVASLLPKEQQPLPAVVPAEREPDLAARYYNSGFAHYEAKEYAEAIADFNRTLEIAADIDALFYRAYSYNESQDYDEAIAGYTDLIELEPDNALFYANRGNAYAGKEDIANAMIDHRTANQIDPYYTPAAFNSAAVAPAVPDVPVDYSRPGIYAGSSYQGEADLYDAIDWIAFYAQNGGKYAVVLGSDQAVNMLSLDFGGKRVTVSLRATGGERTVKFDRNDPAGAMFTVGAGATFTLEDGVIVSGLQRASESLVNVNGGTFIMNGGTLKDSKRESSGGGVFVTSGAFTMTGGTISGNATGANYNRRGGGIYVESGTFTMTGGTISGNTASNYGGGGVYVESGTFTMTGGTISGNTSSNDPTGGGVRVSNGIFTFSGGTISGNVGDGVYVDGGTFTMTGGGTISGNNYGGVRVSNGTFTMTGGEISGNTASSASYGAGVYVASGGYGNSATFTMTGGTISRNSGACGVGVYVGEGTFTMRGGAISGNTASDNGGGVYAIRSGNFTMSAGTISNNTASGDGGGVYVDQHDFTLAGGTISGNTATKRGNNNNNNGDGGGVRVNRGNFTMTGGEISGNTASGGNGGGVSVTSGTITVSNGTIGGNTASGSGGGLWVSGSLTKTTGIIYGSDAPAGQANKASSDETGHAVFVENDRRRVRNDTANARTTLDSAKSRLEGGGWI